MLTHPNPTLSTHQRRYWTVDGSDITVVTMDDTANDTLRERMREDLASSMEGRAGASCTHGSTSFEGVVGSLIEGRGYQLHRPVGSTLDVWEGIDLASSGQWTAVLA
jgi:hypothetical protein